MPFKLQPASLNLQCCVEECSKKYVHWKQIKLQADLPPHLVLKAQPNPFGYACKACYEASLAHRKSTDNGRPSRECSSSSRPPAATPVASRTPSPAVSGAPSC
jgi:hypothetical protein